MHALMKTLQLLLCLTFSASSAHHYYHMLCLLIKLAKEKVKQMKFFTFISEVSRRMLLHPNIVMSFPSFHLRHLFLWCFCCSISKETTDPPKKPLLNDSLRSVAMGALLCCSSPPCPSRQRRRSYS